MRVFNLVYLIVPTLIILVSCTKDNELLPGVSSGTIAVEGTMYNSDGKTPIKNKNLLLAAYMGSGFGGGANVEWPASATTDENGYFKFEYRKNSNYKNLQIEQPHNEHPVMGPFLREIPANQNINRDICIGAKARVEIKVQLQRNLGVNDTLFVYNLGYKTANDSIYSYDLGGGRYPIYIHIYTQNKQPPNNTWIIQGGFHNYYHPQDYSIRWGIGRENFEKALRLEINQNSNSKEYNVLKYPVKSFPETTYVTLVAG